MAKRFTTSRYCVLSCCKKCHHFCSYFCISQALSIFILRETYYKMNSIGNRKNAKPIKGRKKQMYTLASRRMSTISKCFFVFRFSCFPCNAENRLTRGIKLTITPYKGQTIRISSAPKIISSTGCTIKMRIYYYYVFFGGWGWGKHWSQFPWSDKLGLWLQQILS